MAAAPIDEAPSDSPLEFFTLLENPGNEPLPPRSEAPSPEAIKQRLVMKEKILNDFGGRMTPEFQIPEDLRQRVAFWFDVYTHYGESDRIIHHVRYPWIVYKVVDGTQTLLNSKGPLWLRRDRAEKQARHSAEQIRQALRHLSRRSNYRHLTPLEKDLYGKLSSLKGSRRAVFRQAADNVRIQLGQRDFFERGLVNSSRYLPYMEEEFKMRGLPTELTRLPFVESSFNEEARSKVGASGIWQIMPRTGKAYMIVNDQIDERNSPLKATAAAARLLRSYYRAMDTWPLAITSYNNGIGNLKKAIQHAKSHDLATIITRYHHGDFQFASSNFFTCFLAALYSEKYSELIFKNTPRQPLQEREVVRLNGRTRARYLAKVTGLSSADLLKYNLDLRGALKKNASLPKGYRLHLPPGYGDKLFRRVADDKRETPHI